MGHAFLLSLNSGEEVAKDKGLDCRYDETWVQVGELQPLREVVCFSCNIEMDRRRASVR